MLNKYKATVVLGIDCFFRHFLKTGLKFHTIPVTYCGLAIEQCFPLNSLRTCLAKKNNNQTTESIAHYYFFVTSYTLDT